MKLSLYVSPLGRDGWSGLLCEPNAAGNDGPLATVDGARKALRRHRANGPLEAATVFLRGGRYAISQPIRFTPEDSGPVTYCAFENETPVLDGGIDLAGWEETTVHGRRAWVADVAAHLDRYGDFRSLFVQGTRAPRATLPAAGWFRIEAPVGLGPTPKQFEGSNTFVAKAGDFQVFRNLEDVTVVLQHKWVVERMPVVGFDPDTRRVTSSRRSIFHLGPVGAGTMPRYRIENVFEGLTEPGQWYLDRAAQRLYYLPRDGETIGETRVVAPVVTQVLRLEGDPSEGRLVEHLTFRGLTMEHTDWVQPTGWGKRFDPYRHPTQWHPRDSFSHFINNDEVDPHHEYASVPQAAHDLPGAVHAFGARQCTFEACLIRHVGFYAIELGDGCQHNRVIGNVLEDLGGGGLNLDGADLGSCAARFTSHNHVADNHIRGGGRVFPAAVGVLICHGHHNVIAHNEISDFFYSGISVGWTWTRDAHVSRDNVIEFNRIHHLGQGILADLGGIYILGVQPGTILRGNVVHDIEHTEYGGWGIYLDACTSHVLVEHNLVYRTASEGINNNAGNSENIYRHNIIAKTGKAAVAVPRDSDRFATDGGRDRAMTFLHNILCTSGQPMFGVKLHLDREPARRQEMFVSDANLFWDCDSADPAAAGEVWRPNTLSVAQWRDLGCDRNSVVADPCFVDIDADEYRLTPESPALALGFKPFDHRLAGPRGEEQRLDQRPTSTTNDFTPLTTATQS